MSGLRRKFKFSAERLSENAKTISRSPWKLTILQCITNKGQEVLKSLWLSCSWCQIFLHFTFKWCIFRLFIDLRTFVAQILCRDLRTLSADFFVTEQQTPQTFSLLECMLLYVSKKRSKDNLAVYVIRIFVAHQTSFVVKAAKALRLVRRMIKVQKDWEGNEKLCIFSKWKDLTWCSAAPPMLEM